MPQDLQGQMIGGYEIAEEVGRGGMAVVYRAYQSQLERWVAIKILYATGEDNTEFLTRFRREAKAVAALRHPNILTIYDYGEEDGTAYIVMEYVPGGTLKSRLTGEPMPWPDAAALLIPVGKALEYAHSQDIIHRDIKPANILMARKDWPLLADFGLAKLMRTTQGITQPGISLGTPAYLSPEVALGEQVDIRSDVYGLGVLFYELLTGQVPLDADSPVEIVMRRLQEAPAPLSRLSPATPPEVEAVIMRALEREPESRYQTMQAFVEDLARLPGAPGQPVAGVGQAGITARLNRDKTVEGTRFCVAVTGAIVEIPDRDIVLIGRMASSVAEQPDINLEPYGGASGGVSRRHAKLLRQGGSWQLVDLRSTNGTFLNERQLEPEEPVTLRDGDNVRLGSLSLIFLEQGD